MSGGRHLIVRCDPKHLPRLRAEVLDGRLVQVGKVVDVFGNVTAPYATVLCHRGRDVIPGEELFMR